MEHKTSDPAGSLKNFYRSEFLHLNPIGSVVDHVEDVHTGSRPGRNSAGVAAPRRLLSLARYFPIPMVIQHSEVLDPYVEDLKRRREITSRTLPALDSVTAMPSPEQTCWRERSKWSPSQMYAAKCCDDKISVSVASSLLFSIILYFPAKSHIKSKSLDHHWFTRFEVKNGKVRKVRFPFECLLAASWSFLWITASHFFLLKSKFANQAS